MADYYCRFCDDFIRDDETETKVTSILHGEVDTRREEAYSYVVCPKCGYELFERADSCICCKPKLAKDYLCRDCKELAKENWAKCIEELAKDVRCDKYDAKEIIETYVRTVIYEDY